MAHSPNPQSKRGYGKTLTEETDTANAEVTYCEIIPLCLPMFFLSLSHPMLDTLVFGIFVTELYRASAKSLYTDPPPSLHPHLHQDEEPR
jgi:hypothetical protein